MTKTVRSVYPMRTAKTGYLTVSALLAAAGLLLIVRPDFSAAAIGRIAGVLLIAFGAFRLIGYFSRDLYRLAFQFDLVYGVMLVTVGILILTNPAHLMTVLCVIAGICVMADGLLKLRIAADAKRFGIARWWLIGSGAALTVLLGLVLLFRPADSAALAIRLLGAVLLAEGALNFLTAVMTVKIVRNQRPDIIEAEYREEQNQ